MNNTIIIKDKFITINTKESTYQMMVDEHGRLLHTYYGRRADGQMDYLLSREDRGFSGNAYEAGNDRTYSLDQLLQEFPTNGVGDFRSYAFDVRVSSNDRDLTFTNTDNVDSSWGIDLKYVDAKITEGKYALEGLPAVYALDDDEAMTLEVDLCDFAKKIEVKLYYGVLPKVDIITRAAIVINKNENLVAITKCQSAVLDLPGGEYDFIKFTGRHAMERNVERVAVSHGKQEISSRRFTSSHQCNPLMILADKNTSEMAGSCYAMEFVYSGNFKGEAGKDQFGQIRMQLGLNDELFEYPLMSGEKFVAPEVILTYSKDGMNKLSQNLHKCIRNNVCRGKYKLINRPVLVNSWEAAYFNFNADLIVNLAKEAAKVGIDMVVMDDGWFGNRNSDSTSLGDWSVNEEKLGCSLKELADRVNKEGVKFGIWIEPEMVSEDSDFYKKNKGFCLKFKDRNPVRSRNQLVLDFSRKEVRDAVFDQIAAVLESANIEYVKWDMNRSIIDVVSEGTKYPGKVSHDYVLGVYEFLDRLIEKFPNILFEGCSGGGGRFDAGMMYYTPQIWCSDNTDAVDRLRIQYGTSFGYPVSTVGSHVSQVPNHQTGRITSLKTRGIVAMPGTFGYELDLGKLSDDEKEEVKLQVKTYKKFAKLIANGDYYRLSNPNEDIVAAWDIVSEDKSEALVSAVMQEIHGNMPYSFVKVYGLESGTNYKDADTGMIYSADALMEFGLPIKDVMGAYNSYLWHLVRE